MHSFVLQDWITIRGNGTTPVIQGESDWLDLAPYQDLTIWLDVREYSGGSAPTMDFETAPIKEDGLFQKMVGTITLSSISNPSRVPITTANTPVARYVRWKLTGPSGTWDATFRVLLSADALGL